MVRNKVGNRRIQSKKGGGVWRDRIEELRDRWESVNEGEEGVGHLEMARESEYFVGDGAV